MFANSFQGQRQLSGSMKFIYQCLDQLDKGEKIEARTIHVVIEIWHGILNMPQGEARVHALIIVECITFLQRVNSPKDVFSHPKCIWNIRNTLTKGTNITWQPLWTLCGNLTINVPENHNKAVVELLPIMMDSLKMQMEPNVVVMVARIISLLLAANKVLPIPVPLPVGLYRSLLWAYYRYPNPRWKTPYLSYTLDSFLCSPGDPTMEYMSLSTTDRINLNRYVMGYFSSGKTNINSKLLDLMFDSLNDLSNAILDWFEGESDTLEMIEWMSVLRCLVAVPKFKYIGEQNYTELISLFNKLLTTCFPSVFELKQFEDELIPTRMENYAFVPLLRTLIDNLSIPTGNVPSKSETIAIEKEIQREIVIKEGPADHSGESDESLPEMPRKSLEKLTTMLQSGQDSQVTQRPVISIIHKVLSSFDSPAEGELSYLSAFNEWQSDKNMKGIPIIEMKDHIPKLRNTLDRLVQPNLPKDVAKPIVDGDTNEVMEMPRGTSESQPPPPVVPLTRKSDAPAIIKIKSSLSSTIIRQTRNSSAPYAFNGAPSSAKDDPQTLERAPTPFLNALEDSTNILKDRKVVTLIESKGTFIPPRSHPLSTEGVVKTIKLEKKDVLKSPEKVKKEGPIDIKEAVSILKEAKSLNVSDSGPSGGGSQSEMDWASPEIGGKKGRGRPRKEVRTEFDMDKYKGLPVKDRKWKLGREKNNEASRKSRMRQTMKKHNLKNQIEALEIQNRALKVLKNHAKQLHQDFTDVMKRMWRSS